MLFGLDPYTVLWLEWSIGSVSVCLSGILVLNCSNLLPNFINRVVKYGKSADSHDKLKFLELPKKIFYHFYSVALIFYLFLFTLAANIYFNLNLFGNQQQSFEAAVESLVNPSSNQPIATQITGNKSPQFLKVVLDYFAQNDLLTNYRHIVLNFDKSISIYQRAATVPPESVLVGLLMLIVQVSRRLYECMRVSVYSEAKMNVIHYIFGHLFYIGVGLSMLAEAPGFNGQDVSPKLTYGDFFTVTHIVGVLLFVWASYVQFDSHRILANLRKDSSGRVVTTKHMIPRGHWFEYVSSPHYMAEIMIYLAVTIVLSGRSQTWWMVFLFVVTNQIFVGKFNHRWYIDTFRDYPKSRKAIIPFVL